MVTARRCLRRHLFQGCIPCEQEQHAHLRTGSSQSPAPCQEPQLPAFHIKVKLTPRGWRRSAEERKAAARTTGLARRKPADSRAHLPPGASRRPAVSGRGAGARPATRHTLPACTLACAGARSHSTRTRACTHQQSLMSGARVGRRLRRLPARVPCGFGIRLAATALAAVAFAGRYCSGLTIAPS